MTSTKETKILTATQLFSRYMAAIDKIREFASMLAEKNTEAESLSTELAERHGIYVQGKPPANRTTPVTEPDPDEEEEHAPESGKYKPPTQMHSDAPQLVSRGSQEVAEIRHSAGLDIDAEDSESLGAEGINEMANLQKMMGGSPAIVPSPGQVDVSGEPSSGSKTTEGGLPEQKPISEEKK